MQKKDETCQLVSEPYQLFIKQILTDVPIQEYYEP
jgi:hypothetical protein